MAVHRRMGSSEFASLALPCPPALVLALGIPLTAAAVLEPSSLAGGMVCMKRRMRGPTSLASPAAVGTRAAVAAAARGGRFSANRGFRASLLVNGPRVRRFGGRGGGRAGAAGRVWLLGRLVAIITPPALASAAE